MAMRISYNAAAVTVATAEAKRTVIAAYDSGNAHPIRVFVRCKNLSFPCDLGGRLPPSHWTSSSPLIFI
jgi:hypothetical protein